jgi:hypothetical protein
MGKIKSLTEFTHQVRKVMEKNTALYHKTFTTEMGGIIAQMTPVDTGRATANWTASINAPHAKPRQRYDQTITAKPTKEQMENDLEMLKFGDDAYLSNASTGEFDPETGRNIQFGERTGEGYIIQLEKGKSKQAPNGMVLINIARAKAISAIALRLAKREL